jgi:hypothetical protein
LIGSRVESKAGTVRVRSGVSHATLARYKPDKSGIHFKLGSTELNSYRPTVGRGGGEREAWSDDARHEVLALGHHGEGGEQPAVRVGTFHYVIFAVKTPICSTSNTD